MHEQAEIHHKNVQKLGQDMNLKSFGMEHIFREISLIYEAYQRNQRSVDQNINRLPLIVAHLLLNGMAIEAMNGDNSFI